MRHEKAGRLLELARLLASTAEGLTLDEMAERLGVGRRTAERMRDAVREVFPQMEEVEDPPTRRFRIPHGLGFGRSNYLVASEEASIGPRNWRLDKIADIEMAPAIDAKPEGFSLQDYADESFGIYHDDTEDVVLHATPAGAEDAMRWRFH